MVMTTFAPGPFLQLHEQEIDGHAPDDDLGAYRRLWAWVLLQGIQDAKEPIPGPPKAQTKGAREYHRKQLKEWKENRDWIGSEDFGNVCWLAGMDPETVEERIRPLMRPPT